MSIATLFRTSPRDVWAFCGPKPPQPNGEPTEGPCSNRLFVTVMSLQTWLGVGLMPQFQIKNPACPSTNVVSNQLESSSTRWPCLISRPFLTSQQPQGIEGMQPSVYGTLACTPALVVSVSALVVLGAVTMYFVPLMTT